jgi:hypothetical protein
MRMNMSRSPGRKGIAAAPHGNGAAAEIVEYIICEVSLDRHPEQS